MHPAFLKTLTLILLGSLSTYCSQAEIESTKNRTKDYAKTKDALTPPTPQEDAPPSVASGLALSTLAYDPSQLGQISEVKADYVDLLNEAPGIIITPVATTYSLPFEYKICADGAPEVCFPSAEDKRSFYGPSGISHFHLSGGELRVSVRQCFRSYQIESESELCTDWVDHSGAALLFPSLEIVPELANRLAQAEASKSNLRTTCLQAVSSVAAFLNKHNDAITDPNLYALLRNSVLSGEDNCTYAMLGSLDLFMEDSYQSILEDLESYGGFNLDIADAFNLLSLMSGLAITPESFISYNESEGANLTAFFKVPNFIRRFIPESQPKSYTKLAEAPEAKAKNLDLIKDDEGTGYLFIKSNRSKSGLSAADELADAQNALNKLKEGDEFFEAATQELERAQKRYNGLIDAAGGSEDLVKRTDLDTGVWLKLSDEGKYLGVVKDLPSVDDLPPGTRSRLSPEGLEAQFKQLRALDANADKLQSRRKIMFNGLGLAEDEFKVLPKKIQDKYTPVSGDSRSAKAHNKRVQKNLDKLEGTYKPNRRERSFYAVQLRGKSEDEVSQFFADKARKSLLDGKNARKTSEDIDELEVDELVFENPELLPRSTDGNAGELPPAYTGRQSGDVEEDVLLRSNKQNSPREEDLAADKPPGYTEFPDDLKSTIDAEDSTAINAQFPDDLKNKPNLKDPPPAYSETDPQALAVKDNSVTKVDPASPATTTATTSTTRTDPTAATTSTTSTTRADPTTATTSTTRADPTASNTKQTKKKTAEKSFNKAKTSNSPPDAVLLTVAGLVTVGLVGGVAFSYLDEENTSSQVDGVATGEIDPADEQPSGANLTLTTQALDTFDSDLSRMVLDLATLYQILQEESLSLATNEAIAGLVIKQAAAELAAEAPQEANTATTPTEFDEFGNPIASQAAEENTSEGEKKTTTEEP